MLEHKEKRWDENSSFEQTAFVTKSACSDTNWQKLLKLAACPVLLLILLFPSIYYEGISAAFPRTGAEHWLSSSPSCIAYLSGRSLLAQRQ